jgi:hypothetical protein
LSEEEQIKLALAASAGKIQDDDSVEILDSLPLHSGIFTFLSKVCSSIKPLNTPEPTLGDLTRIQFSKT